MGGVEKEESKRADLFCGDDSDGRWSNYGKMTE
jgi:hypothetical protein